MIQIRSRVGAVRDADESVVNLFGYGVYAGEEIPPKGVGLYGIDLHDMGLSIPKIVLDNGSVVWGCQCWWGSEDKIKKWIRNRKVNIVPVS